MQLKVFLTGATGYIGGAIADALLAGGHTVVGLARSGQAGRTLAAKGITPFEGDLCSPASLQKAAAESDGVIHAGTTNDGGFDQEAVRVILEALRDTGKPLIYTAVSGCWAIQAARSRMKPGPAIRFRWWLGGRAWSNWCSRQPSPEFDRL